MIEVWKDIPGLPNYQASNIGNIKSLPRDVITTKGFKTRRGKGLLKKTIGNHGYYVVNVNDKAMTVHRLVAIAFIPNPDNLPVVNHIDAVRTNNLIENLEWCTDKQNVHHTMKMGRKSPQPIFYGADHGMSLMTINVETGIIYDSIKEAHKSTAGKIDYKSFAAMVSNKRKNKTKFKLA